MDRKFRTNEKPHLRNYQAQSLRSNSLKKQVFIFFLKKAPSKENLKFPGFLLKLEKTRKSA